MKKIENMAGLIEISSPLFENETKLAETMSQMGFLVRSLKTTPLGGYQLRVFGYRHTFEKAIRSIRTDGFVVLSMRRAFPWERKNIEFLRSTDYKNGICSCKKTKRIVSYC